MFRYSVAEALEGEWKLVTIPLVPFLAKKQLHLPLAIALLPMLNSETSLPGQFGHTEGEGILYSNDLVDALHHEDVQRVAEQAQEVLSEYMDEAVALFQVVEAVASVEPYRTIRGRVNPQLPNSYRTYKMQLWSQREGASE